MNEAKRGLILRDAEVKALLSAGEVTITRAIKPQPPYGCAYTINAAYNAAICTDEKSAREGFTSSTIYVPPTPRSVDYLLPCPYGALGDVRFVRETMAPRLDVDGTQKPEKARHYAKYRADGIVSPYDPMDWHSYPTRWTPAGSMPEWASRLDVKIASVNVAQADGKWTWIVGLNIGARRDVEWI